VGSKAGRFVEGLHVVGGITTVSKISICMCLNSAFKCMSVMLAILSCIPLR
jgi:hypothetical protein